MRPKVQQLGIVATLDSDAPADYRHTEDNPLNRQVWYAIHQRGAHGASSTEIAKELKKPAKSIAGRCTELHSLGRLRKTEAWRNGIVYVAVD